MSRKPYYESYEETHPEWVVTEAERESKKGGSCLGGLAGSVLAFALIAFGVYMFREVIGLTSTPTSTPPPTATLTKIPRASAILDAELKATKPPALTAEDIIPKDYYDRPCLIPKGVSLNSYLTEYEWVDPYQANSWDCSQMSAYIEWLVENCGYEANIVIAKRIDHAWVDIKIGNKWRPYEATSGSFYFWPEILNEIYEGRTLTFEDIYEVYDDLTRGSSEPSYVIVMKNHFLREWAWWEEAIDDRE